jgi:hypothetical protein
LKFLEHKLIKGVPRYGHWLGPVASGSQFFSAHVTLGWSNHGWIELPDKRICDPTRWVFEDTDPYVFLGEDTEGFYDINGNKFFAAQPRPIPKFKKSDKVIEEPKDKQLTLFIKNQLLKGTPKITLPQCFWLANRPPDELAPHTKEIYQWLVDTKRKAWIPVENGLLVLGK